VSVNDLGYKTDHTLTPIDIRLKLFRSYQDMNARIHVPIVKKHVGAEFDEWWSRQIARLAYLLDPD
jgi:hypothetical protein